MRTTFSKITDKIFIKFQIKFWFLEDKQVTQPGKNLVLGKKPEIFLKVGFFEVGKNFIPLMCYFSVYKMYHTCLYGLAKTACFGEISFSSYKRKCSQPIRWQEF